MSLFPPYYVILKKSKKPLLFKINYEALALSGIVDWRCLLSFRIETIIYSEVMQDVQNATKQLNTSAWHRRRPRIVGGGGGGCAVRQAQLSTQKST